MGGTNRVATGGAEAKKTMASQEQAKRSFGFAMRARLSGMTGRPARLVMLAVPALMLAVAISVVTTTDALSTEPLGKLGAWLAKSVKSIRPRVAVAVVSAPILFGAVVQLPRWLLSKRDANQSAKKIA